MRSSVPGTTSASSGEEGLLREILPGLHAKLSEFQILWLASPVWLGATLNLASDEAFVSGHKCAC